MASKEGHDAGVKRKTVVPSWVILEACRKFHAGKASTPDIELSKTYTVEAIMTQMQKMADEGVLEYSVSLRTAWVVDRWERLG